jgi:CRISPR-associated endonuclease/helicase Cas3
MLDTAAVAREVLHREPARTRGLFAQDFGLDPESALAWVSALAGLHDLGKASPAFQHLWSPGADRVRKAGLIWSSVSPPRSVPHNLVSQIVAEELLQENGFTAEMARQISDAIGAHHGFRAHDVELDEVGSEELGNEAWNAVRRELHAALLETMEAHQVPTSLCLPAAAFVRLAGLVSLADWIASSPQHFRLLAVLRGLL